MNSKLKSLILFHEKKPPQNVIGMTVIVRAFIISGCLLDDRGPSYCSDLTDPHGPLSLVGKFNFGQKLINFNHQKYNLNNLTDTNFYLPSREYVQPTKSE